MGDQFGNPARKTAIYFSTGGGNIVSSATSDDLGNATANIQGGNPAPNTPALGGAGYGYITASMFGKDSTRIQKRIPFLFSGAPKIVIPNSGFIMQDSGSATFNFKVSDQNGNPLVAGTTISVSKSGASEDFDLTGDVSRTMIDTQDTSSTNFSFTVQDKKGGGVSGTVSFTVTVTGENGTSTSSFAGTLLGAGINPGVPGGGYASYIRLESKTNSTISVRGTGSIESSTLTFQVMDSLGNPITLARAVQVKFTLIKSPSDSAFLYPTAATTDANGRVVTTLNSGTKAGVLQVVDSALVLTHWIYSAPTQVTIVGGFPDSNAITATISRLNLPGYIKSGPLATVTVQMGDKFGNPPQPSALYFGTNAGVIKGSATSDASGMASVPLSGGNPIPTNGKGAVMIQTRGELGTTITKTVPFLFSGTPTITVPSSGFVIQDSGSATFSYKVADQNGNPLSSGTTISVTVDGPGSGDLQLQGDMSLTMGDTQDTNATKFSMQVIDKGRGGAYGTVNIRIAVSGDNGAASAAFSGTLLSSVLGGGGGIIGGFVGAPYSLSVVGTPSTSLTVNEGGGQTSLSTVSFQVRDSLGNPFVYPLNRLGRHAYVGFSLVPSAGLGGGEALTMSGDSTNDQGQVMVTFRPGTKSGIIRLAATSQNSNGQPIASGVDFTISGGFPDSNRISLNLERVNMPGLVKQGTIGSARIQVGDQFGNPSRPSDIYFTISGGNIVPKATTDALGTATVTVQGGNPAPNTPGLGGIGNGYVTAVMYGRDSIKITKQIPFLFSGAPRITVPAFTNDTLPTVGNGGSLLVNLKIADANGRPLSNGNSVSVQVSGIASSGIVLSGNTAVALQDTRDTNNVNYTFTLSDGRAIGGGNGGPFMVTILVSGESGSVTKVIYGSLQSPTYAGTSSGYASSIELISASRTTVSVRGTGAPEASIITWQLKDSLGNPISSSKKSMVTFSIQGGPGGTVATRPFMNPDSVYSDANGTVISTFNSGTIAGVVQVVASTVVSGRTISSAPVAITVNGGLPDSTRITVWSDAVNYPGGVVQGKSLGRVFVQLGDRYGNPVQPGTTVYFTTSGGIIDARGTTNGYGQVIGSDGGAGALLFGGNPLPVGGIDTVTISTVVDGGVNVRRKAVVTFSGTPVIARTGVVSQQDTVTVFDGASQDVNFTVKDANSNPLSAGNAITVNVTGVAASGITASGDLAVTTFDTRSTGTGITDFSVRLSDVLTGGGTSGIFLVTIRVTGPNVPAGSSAVLYQFYGNLQPPQAIVPPSPTVKYPAQIAFISVSATDLFVSGVGALENSVITYEVRDSLGSPIEKSTRAYSTFSLTFYPNGNVSQGTNPTPKLIPSADSTDDQGRLRVSVLSGTQAGVVQLVAQITLTGGSIVKSQPVRVTVHAGFPDQKHFTVAATAYNFPGLQQFYQRRTVTVQVADRYSNPVQTGTAVYFNTLNGSVQTGGSNGLTAADGFVSADLISSNPLPTGADTLTLPLSTWSSTLSSSNKNGWSQVYARTLGDSSRQVIDSILVLWTGKPIIDTAGSSVTHTFGTLAINGGAAGPWVFSVKDLYGHPMSSGTTITVSAGSLQIDGDVSTTLGDNFVAGSGVTDFRVSVSNQNTSYSKIVPVVVMVTVSHSVYGTFTKILGTGSMQQ
ncbi:MAG: hypothetical protein HY966_05880 [Ignavibacteriales bacterium]|nr:hypothetical protein [Ignavibacteriales bacterium]